MAILKGHTGVYGSCRRSPVNVISKDRHFPPFFYKKRKKPLAPLPPRKREDRVVRADRTLNKRNKLRSESIEICRRISLISYRNRPSKRYAFYEDYYRN